MRATNWIPCKSQNSMEFHPKISAMRRQSANGSSVDYSKTDNNVSQVGTTTTSNTTLGHNWYANDQETKTLQFPLFFLSLSLFALALNFRKLFRNELYFSKKNYFITKIAWISFCFFHTLNSVESFFVRNRNHHNVNKSITTDSLLSKYEYSISRCFVSWTIFQMFFFFSFGGFRILDVGWLLGHEQFWEYAPTKLEKWIFGSFFRSVVRRWEYARILFPIVYDDRNDGDDDQVDDDDDDIQTPNVISVATKWKIQLSFPKRSTFCLYTTRTSAYCNQRSYRIWARGAERKIERDSDWEGGRTIVCMCSTTFWLAMLNVCLKWVIAMRFSMRFFGFKQFIATFWNFPGSSPQVLIS